MSDVTGRDISLSSPDFTFPSPPILHLVVVIARHELASLYGAALLQLQET
jgi:hypothetical protein